MGISNEEFLLVQRLVHKEAGIVLEAGKEYLVEARLSALARQRAAESIHAVIGAIREASVLPADVALRRAVCDAMTTNETSFFRDVKPFEALRQQILPALIEQRKAARSLNIWCAASSTGQEPYSIAMTLREMQPGLESWQIKFIATDLCEATLTRARSGKFTQLEVNRGLPAQQLVKHFTKVGTEWEIHPALRKMVDFRQLNLLGTWPTMPAPDLVFIRNVLIYFDSPTKTQILGRIRRLMRPDGFLFLGNAETTLNIDDGYDRLALDRSGCYRLKGQPPFGVTTAAKAA